MKNSWVVGFLIITGFIPAYAKINYYKTTTGAIFNRVQTRASGPGWKAPGGAVWSPYQGPFPNAPFHPDQNGAVVDSAATEACKRIGGRLPTKADYEKLFSNFERQPNDQFPHIIQFSQQGGRDFLKLFPVQHPVDINGEYPSYVWTSSVNLADSKNRVWWTTFPDNVYPRGGGDFTYFASREDPLDVYCIIPL